MKKKKTLVVISCSTEYKNKPQRTIWMIGNSNQLGVKLVIKPLLSSLTAMEVRGRSGTMRFYHSLQSTHILLLGRVYQV